MSDKPPSARRGIPTCVSLTPEAAAVLREISPGPGLIGQTLSILILEDRARREERAKAVTARVLGEMRRA